MIEGKFYIKQTDNKERLDNVFLSFMPSISRSHIKQLIEKGEILLNNKIVKAGEKVKTGQEVKYSFEEEKPLSATAEEIDFEIIYEDSDLLVVNKPQGLVVHPCSSTKSGTLVNGLLARVKDLSGINGVLRPGIVHRLDKNTSGLLLVAKNDFAHRSLAEQIKNKTCQRKYIALCEGVFGKDDDYRVLKRFIDKTLVEFTLQTGRTHQIRVHCQMLNHPIVGDDIYGKKEKNLQGQLLHAYKITFIHPRNDKEMTFECELPLYFKQYLEKLK